MNTHVSAGGMSSSNSEDSGGTTSTPNTYSLMVRPRETRATKVPTKGDQAMTQAQ